MKTHNKHKTALGRRTQAKLQRLEQWQVPSCIGLQKQILIVLHLNRDVAVMSLGLFWSLFEYFWFCPIKNISPCTCLVSLVSAQHHQSPLAIIFSLRHTLLAYWTHKHINHLIKTLHHHISIFFLCTLEFKTTKFDRRDSRCSSFYAAMSGSSHMIWPHSHCLSVSA